MRAWDRSRARRLRAIVALGLTVMMSAPSTTAARAAHAPAPKPALPIASQPKAAGGSISAYDLIELQIAYTTLLAVYYKPIEPRTLVMGARRAIAAEIAARGVRDLVLPAVPASIDRDRGSDLVDTFVLQSLARARARLDGHRLVTAAVAGELASLHDPYTVAFVPQQFKKFNAYLGNASFGGVGAIVTLDPSGTSARVERALPDGPGYAAGLRDNDTIVAIDSRTIAQIGTAHLRDALRGRVGTTVRLDVRRGDERVALAIVRATVRDPEVRSALLGEIGYVELTRFGDRAGRELGAAVAALRGRGARAFVLDLRGNGGGYGDEATAVAAIFMGGPIFITRDRTGVPRIARATMTTPFPERLAILVDGDTASAAEIVAGALQDAGRATIVGEKTFGKGLVQSVFPLPDGSALKITTARYTTPKGRDIDHIGIVPDVPVASAAATVRGNPATDVQLARAIEVLGAGTATPEASSPSPNPSASM